MLLDAEDVYLALTRKETSLFESPGGLECACVERAYSKILAENQRILVEAHHRPRGGLINGLAKPMVRPPAPSPQQPTPASLRLKPFRRRLLDLASRLLVIDFNGVGMFEIIFTR